MSTIAPPSKPLNPALVDSEHYIDDQIRRTRRSLKLVDLAAGLITLTIGLLAFVLLAAVLDHWVVPGGLNVPGRIAVFGLMLAAIAWYGWRQFVPLLRSINPVYAAHTIERNSPSLKNSLLNLLMFRTHRQHMSTRVYHALEQQAAQRLSTATLDTTIDRSALLRLGYALLAIIAVCAAYSVLSPKNMALSAARVLAPWSDLAAPSRVHIMDVRPGDMSLARGERLEIAATIGGLRADDSIRVHYSTADEQLVDESVSMKAPDAGLGRFVAELPRGGDAAVEAGVQQNLVYWIEAGDAHSKKFNVTVFSRPTIIVQKVQYEYPAYTGFPSAEIDSTGDIRALEGTQVTISALANQRIKSAYVDFDADGRNDLRMTVDGDHATARFPLALKADRRTPKFQDYILKFTSAEGRSNVDPPKYRIEVTPDYAPEVRVTSPEEPERTVRVNETVLIELEARDPDFALSSVRLIGKVGDREATLAEPLAKKHEGRFGAIKPFTPGDVKLKPGDVLEYWAEARDNRRPDANVALSEHRRLKIAGPAEGPQPENQKNGESASAVGQRDQQKPSESGEAGEQNEGGPQQPGDQSDGESEESDNGSQQGVGGAGANGQQNEKAQSEQGVGGAGESGQAQSNDQKEQGPGGAGASSQNDADQSQPGESASAGGQNEQTQPGAQEQPGNPEGAEQGQQQEKVSTDGSDDVTAFQKLAEKLNPQTNPKESAGESASAGGQNAQPQDADPAQAKPSEAAANNPDEPQGAADPSASETTDGKLSEEKGAQKPSQEGATNENPGDAGAGHNSEEQEGPPAASGKKAVEKRDADESNKKLTDDKEPPSDAGGKRESDTDGGQSGDQTGGGQEGGGQQADAPGKGQPGQNEPADAGGGQANEKGEGETGTNAGDGKTADGKTGESSGDKKGEGSQQGKPDEPNTGESASAGGPTGESASADGPNGESPTPSDPDGKQPAAQPDSKPGQPAGGKSPKGADGAQPGGEPGGSDSAGQPPQDGKRPDSAEGKPGEPQSPNQPSGGGQAGSSQPQGGGQGGVAEYAEQPDNEEAKEDEANLKFAQQQTDLVLERLDDQLAKKKVDAELLKSLGWSEAELRQFVNRWKALKARTGNEGEDGEKARQELDGALRSLGLRQQGPTRVRAASQADKLRVNDSYRARPPIEYADRVREYSKGVGAQDN